MCPVFAEKVFYQERYEPIPNLDEMKTRAS
jgi:hypothetical protein